ncbi:MAG TPA: hypothetical protein VKE51_37100 [Vicinamibacterales bacterium]|nr:hypothetical protein [Vicinamibacterales bacterium]
MEPRIATVAPVSLLTAILSLVVPALHAQSNSAFGEAAARSNNPIVITIETENHVQYRGDIFDPAQYAKNPNQTTAPVITFAKNVQIADIVKVNGEPAKGLWTTHFLVTPFRRNPAPGQVIADLDSSALVYCAYEIVAPDGSYIGTLFVMGIGEHHAVVGGVGAFANATGIMKMEVLVRSRAASMSEDPSMRRIYGGGRFRSTFYIHVHADDHGDADSQ